ncbi:hypothetical protein [Bradyrhizobium sp. Leo170]|uniref:hypothetical protein n=1 Tax=Bradyrhizobium sp. Leo170 TaxID=1571199 RepID=UPI0010EE2222|nr:hypothetical protein [Bradyrhizobium sp. Leo170]TAI60060.1 hypothetical protein CWO89_42785 [Bradyrhizobium sp. Leo170]
MLANYHPRSADIDGKHLIFYDHEFALGRVELHEDQQPDETVWPDDGGPPVLVRRPGTENTVEIWPDDWEGGDRMFVRVIPKTLRIFERGVIPDRGTEHLYFDRETNRQFILDDLPALALEAHRRAYLAGVARWERHPAQDDDNAELPPFPVFEPARAEWQAWQDAVTERDALWAQLDHLKSASRVDPQCGAVDFLMARIEKLAHAYWSKVPVTEPEKKCTDEVRRQKLYGPPANALVGQTSLAIASLAARPIDDFNEGWYSVERWPDGAPQMPPQVEESYPAIFHQLNSAVRRITTMAQKPRTFRADRVAHIIAILEWVYPDTCKALCDLIRSKKCALPDEALSNAKKHFEQRLMWEVQGRNRGSYVANSRGVADPASFDNIRIFLKLRGVDLRFDEFTNSIEVSEGVSIYQWRRTTEDQRKALWLDTHTSAHNFNCSWDFFRASIDRIAREDSYDSLRDSIDALKWDGVKRLDGWLSRLSAVRMTLTIERLARTSSAAWSSARASPARSTTKP